MMHIDGQKQDNLYRGEHVISYPATSQYSHIGGGVSACGLAVLNCIRLVLGKEKSGTKGESLLQWMSERGTMEQILEICLSWSINSHLEVDDLYEAPLFRRTLSLDSRVYASSDYSQFKRLLSSLGQTTREGSCAVAITRPPEIVACMRIVTAQGPVFVIFDSHPRPEKHPQGAAFIFNSSLEDTAMHLSRLLAYDRGLLADGAMQWQAQLLANYSGHVFRARDVLDMPPHWVDAIVESSLSVLKLRAELEDSKLNNQTLESENRRLSEELSKREDEVRHLRSERARNSRTASTSSSSQAWHDRKGKLPMHGTNSPLPPNGTPTLHTKKFMIGKDSELAVMSRSCPKLEDDQDSFEYAIRKQREFEEEDKQLREQAEALQHIAPKLFTCGICLEEHSEESVARIEACGHPFCRHSLRDYVCSKLKEGRFPIFCPSCMASQNAGEYPMIDNPMVHQLGISDVEYATFVEFELASLSVLMHCPGCKKSMFVDKNEYQNSELIACPLPECTHVWCRLCSQTIEIGGPKHSCDGSSELNNLMQQRGWKHCPGCKTPTEKIDGCNHMTCMSPGCNTHFCYICGKSIVQSVRRENIQRAISAHYRRCQLFAVPR